MGDNRKIIHIDMDAFYASVEVRDNPELKGKPIVVGGDPSGRGVVATCSYEARVYGIHSAMACKVAKSLCPHVIFVRPRFEVYKQVSAHIRGIFMEYTDKIEPLSLDEAYLDVTNNKKGVTFATEIAKEIKERIKCEVGITCSAGVSYNKFVAKLASDYQKPNGLTVVTPKQADEFIESMPIQKIHGIGKKTANQLMKIGVKTAKDLKQLEYRYLVDTFNKRGHMLYYFVRGIDNREVEVDHAMKSIGSETTFSEDLVMSRENIERGLKPIALKLSDRIQKYNIQARTMVIKVTYSDFRKITRSMTTNIPIRTLEGIESMMDKLITKVENPHEQMRLVGITLANCEKMDELPYTSLSLFDVYSDLTY